MLSDEQKIRFQEQGYLVLPQLVSPQLIRAALKAVNARIGQGMDQSEMVTFRNQSFCPELREDAAICGLFQETPLAAVVESLLGQGQVFRHPKAQIALRFPQLKPEPAPPVPHVDGFYTDANGVAPGSIATFSGIAGVFLSDVPEENAGNFTVWPGTHRQFAEYYREHAPDPALPNGIPPVPLPAPVQLTARAGDVVLAHYLLAHTAAANVSPWVRYGVFFRFQHVGHKERRLRDLVGLLRDPWAEWEGLL